MLKNRLLQTRLLKPLDYLRVQAIEKRRYDFFYPLIAGFCITALLFFSPIEVQIFGNSGLIDLIIGILQILTGFYIASLAAVATFNKEGMDELMSGKPPKLLIWLRGTTVIIELTRRRFLSLLFGYLAFLSISMYFLGGAANLIAPGIINLIPSFLHICTKWFFILIYLTVTSNLIVTTLLGLYYMCDRIHRD